MPKRDSVLAKLGLNLRQRREARELTQEKLAEKAGLDPTYISGIERGLRNPGIKNVARLAKALGFTTAELCKGVDACMGNPNAVGLRCRAAQNPRRTRRSSDEKTGRRSSTALPHSTKTPRRMA